MTWAGAFTNAKAIASRLRRLKSVPSRVGVAFAQYVDVDMRKAFDAGRSVDGRTWPGYSAGSIAIGRDQTPKLVGLPRLGEASGALRASIDAEPTQGAGVRVTVGAGIAYATYPSFGGTPGHWRFILPQSMPRTWATQLQTLIDEEYTKSWD